MKIISSVVLLVFIFTAFDVQQTATGFSSSVGFGTAWLRCKRDAQTVGPNYRVCTRNKKRTTNSD